MPTLTRRAGAVGRARSRATSPPGSFVTGAVYCPATQQVFFDEPLASDLYDRFGDFVVGYMLGGAWSEAAQVAARQPARGRAAVPGRRLPDRRVGRHDRSPTRPATDAARPAVIEPGDLDEAIQTALVVGDESASDDVLGSGFEKIASFREGVLDGLEACLGRIGD